MACFSSNGSYFAQISAEGKLNVWETATSNFKQEFTPDFHLTSPCTCLHFIQVNTQDPTQNGTPKKKAKRQKSSSTAPYIALGTKSGTVLFYSISDASVSYSIDSKTGESITSISWLEGSTLYSGANQHVIVWNASKRTVQSKWKAGNDRINSVLALPGGERMLSASKNIKLWNVDSKEILKTFTGHASEVIAMKFIENGGKDDYFISASSGDRVLSCWNLNEKSREKNSIANFLMEDIVVSVPTVAIASDNSTVIAVCTRSGVVHMYNQTLNGKCGKPLKPQVTLQVASDTGQSKDATVTPVPITGAFLKEDTSVLICYGNAGLLTFESIVPNTFEKVQCLIRTPRKAGRSGDAQYKAKIAKTVTPLVDENSVEYLTSAVGSSTAKQKRKSDGSTLYEVPMEKRLENLTLKSTDLSAKGDGGSVAQLLVQGLHSRDEKILKSALYRKEEDVIRNTVKRLPVTAIVPLVEELGKFIRGKTLCCQIGSIWLRHLLQQHAGLLVSNPELISLLAPLLNTIESRVTLMTPLNRLRGRLNLLLSQCDSLNSANGEDEKSAENAEENECFVYKDTQESSEDEDQELQLDLDNVEAGTESDAAEWMEDDDGNSSEEKAAESDDEMSESSEKSLN